MIILNDACQCGKALSFETALWVVKEKQPRNFKHLRNLSEKNSRGMSNGRGSQQYFKFKADRVFLLKEIEVNASRCFSVIPHLGNGVLNAFEFPQICRKMHIIKICASTIFVKKCLQYNFLLPCRSLPLK